MGSENAVVVGRPKVVVVDLKKAELRAARKTPLFKMAKFLLEKEGLGIACATSMSGEDWSLSYDQEKIGSLEFLEEKIMKGLKEIIITKSETKKYLFGLFKQTLYIPVALFQYDRPDRFLITLKSNKHLKEIKPLAEEISKKLGKKIIIKF